MRKKSARHTASAQCNGGDDVNEKSTDIHKSIVSPCDRIVKHKIPPLLVAAGEACKRNDVERKECYDTMILTQDASGVKSNILYGNQLTHKAFRGIIGICIWR